MPRAQFEYDEIGNTFYYVIVSFFAVILFPLTHFLWPSLPKRQEYIKRGCRCDGDLQKRYKKEQIKPWEKAKCVIKGIILFVLWILFLLLAYKDSDVTEIKKKYRELSKTHHPDKGGDPVTFDAIVKAYKALTDEESRENWRLYGNPDGPKATTFGIALPKWIVSEQYGNWVLALYTLIFMIILPVGVVCRIFNYLFNIFKGMWWYNSIKYSADKVLLETSRLYVYFLQKTTNMNINRITMVLAGSFEFCKKFNTEIIERESDDKEIPNLMKQLTNLKATKKEHPLCLPWSLKARTLLHAYFTRITLTSENLITDQNYIISRSMVLLEEFLRILLQMMHWPTQRTPTINCLENTIRLFPMIVQALWEHNTNLLQLPHITEKSLFLLRKYRINTCQDLVKLSESKRRSLLNTITYDQYEDVIYVLSMMPRLEIETKIEGEEDKETVTIGSVVTLKVTLKRFPLLDLEKRKEEIAEGVRKEVIQQQDCHKSIDDQHDDDEELKPNKRKVWEKQPKKKPKKSGKNKKVPPSKQNIQILNDQKSEINTNVDKTTKELTENEFKIEDKKQNMDQSDSEKESGDETISGKNEENDTSDRESLQGLKGGGGPSCSDNDDDWDEQNDEIDDDFVTKKEVLLESEPTNYHEVHCPYYPGDKYEWWFIYLLERKTRKFIAMVPCKTLDQEKTFDLRFPAPSQKGNHFFTLHIRSDSYKDFDYSVDVKMEVHPAREPPQVKYQDTEDEIDLQEKLDSSEGEYTESSDSEDEK